MLNALASINELIVGLYRFGRELPMAKFQGWALARVREVIDFDSALWRAGGDSPRDAICLYGQPEQLMEEYVRDGWPAEDFVRARCAAHPGVTINMAELTTSEGWHGMPMYRRFARRYGIEWVLCTHLVDPNRTVKEVVSLWRHDALRPFTEEERLAKQLLMPHLAESLRANRRWHFAASARTPSGASAAMAVCDRGGRLHESTSAFTRALRTEWPQWTGGDLPAPLVVALENGRYRGQRIEVDAQALGDQWLISARSIGAERQLGQRELLVARMYAQGLTYRMIAAQIGVSPATVRNQLRSCFSKLGVASKLELARRLEQVGDPAPLAD
jgi:DNA-binding CsgD family transcriptional regulator